MEGGPWPAPFIIFKLSLQLTGWGRASHFNPVEKSLTDMLQRLVSQVIVDLVRLTILTTTGTQLS